jgi:hypothetical protein
VISYQNYIHEILSHAGLPYLPITPNELQVSLLNAQILLTIGNAVLTDDQRTSLDTFVRSGGSWINLCGFFDMSELLGVDLIPPPPGWASSKSRTIGEGYLVPASSHPIVSGIEKPLHFYNGLGLRATTAGVIARYLDVHGRATQDAVLFETSVDQGIIITCGVDLTGTVVMVQQGRSVTRDGFPAPDGSATISDGVLKSGDGTVLDWIFDREEAPGTGMQAFIRPVADLWRDLLLRCIFYCASKKSIPLPLLWYWPRNLTAVAHMSNDTDLNEADRGYHLLNLLAKADIRSTWCMILPGYPQLLINAINAAGHELGMHYDAMTPGLDYSQNEFDRQYSKLVELFGTDVPKITTNKNHYLRWEGDMQLFDWCVNLGIQVDQTKGASKTGEAGYNFGSCHPYFPVRFNGDPVDVIEFATPTQDLIVFAKEELLDSLLQTCLRHHGILHTLFHPTHCIRKTLATHSFALLRKQNLQVLNGGLLARLIIGNVHVDKYHIQTIH